MGGKNGFKEEECYSMFFNGRDFSGYVINPRWNQARILVKYAGIGSVSCRQARNSGYKGWCPQTVFFYSLITHINMTKSLQM